jgi:cytochrome c oxidase assembly protein subunit 15
MQAQSKLALFAVLLAFSVILLGAFTRLTDAGLSCPDWPNCYGFITAPHTDAQLLDAAQKYPSVPVNVKKAWTEMTHRYFAGTEGVLILILAGTFFFSHRLKSMKSFAIGLALIGLLCVQVLLGMLTVTKNLKPVIVLSHLVTGISILSVLWWAYLEFYLPQNTFAKRTLPGIKKWLWFGFIIIAMQIMLGGWVSTHYAGLACIDFPYCNGSLIPSLHWDQLNSDLITIHMLHRFGAFVTATYMTFLAIYLLNKPGFRYMAITLFVLTFLQISLGILNLLWLRPVWIALMHHGVGITILLTMIAAIVKANRMTRG